MKNKDIKFSVISVNFNGGDKIVESIKSIVNQNYKNLEIIIVDNGSKDNSIKKIENLKLNNIKILKLEKNLGFTTGSNIGIKNCNGKYFLILNNDAYLDNVDFVKNSIDILENSEKKIIGIFPKVVFNWEQKVLNSTYVTWHHKYLWHDDENGKLDLNVDKINKEVFGAMFVAPIFKKELWLKIGGFDDFFFTYGEDFDISYRANVLGYKFLYCPNIKVKHDFRSSSKEDTNPLWSYFYFQRNYLYVILKNYQTINLLRYFKHYSSFFLNSLKSGLRNRNLKLINLHLRVIKDILSNLPHLLKERKIIQKDRKINDCEVWNYDFNTNYNPYFYNNKIVLNLNSIENEK